MRSFFRSSIHLAFLLRLAALGLPLSLALPLAMLFTGCGPAEQKPKTEATQSRAQAQDSAEYHANVAQEAAARNDWPQAHEHIDQAIKKTPTYDKYVYMKARYYYLAGEPQFAYDTAKKAESLKGEADAARHLQALALLQLNRNPEAIALLETLCNSPLFMAKTEACGVLGFQYMTLHEPAKAKVVFNRLVQIDDQDFRGHYYLGQIACNAKDWRECASRCGIAAELVKKKGFEAVKNYGPLYGYCAAQGEKGLGNAARAAEHCTWTCETSQASESCRKCEQLLAAE